jgi:Ca2+-binding RTX toxin-like protein
VVLALVALFGLPTAAFAVGPTTVNFNASAPFTTMTVNAAGGEENVIAVAGSTTITIKDTGSGDVNMGTNAAAAGCVNATNTNQVNCPIGDITSITVNAGDLDDRVTFLTSAVATTANGEAGDDTLLGGNGADDLNGGPDDDTIRGGSGGDDIDGGANSVAPAANPGDWVDYSGASAVVVTLDAGVDDDGRDTSPAAGHQSEGDDVVNVENVEGGSQGDSITGDADANELVGGDGNDDLDGLAGNDLFSIEGGNDGNDDLSGGADTDTASYSLASAVVTVTVDGVANDGVAGELDNVGTDIEVVVGGSGGDNLSGGAGPQTLRGGSGNDTLNGDAGTDILVGNGGSDTVSYAGRGTPVTITLNGLADDGGAGENDNVNADIENALGGSGADNITGNGGVNRLTGGPGADQLHGAGGNDVLVGDSDGVGDTYDGGSGSDTVTYAAVAGPVNVIADGSASPFQGEVIESTVENLTGTPAGDTLTGNASRNVLNGQDGNDVLNGDLGNDVLNGGRGDDTLHGNEGSDSMNGGPGPDPDPVNLPNWTDADTIDGGIGIDSVSYSTREANLTLTVGLASGDGEAGEGDVIQADTEKVTGGRGDDTITGDASNETLTGGAGNDTIDGNGGKDSLNGNAGNDTIFGGGGQDIISGATGNDTLNTNDGLKDTVNCGDGNDITNNDGADALASNCFP